MTIFGFARTPRTSREDALASATRGLSDTEGARDLRLARVWIAAVLFAGIAANAAALFAMMH